MPLFIRLLLYIFSRFGRLVLWEIIFILELQFAETQENKNIVRNPLCQLPLAYNSYLSHKNILLAYFMNYFILHRISLNFQQHFYTNRQNSIQTRKLRAVSVFVLYLPFIDSIFRQANTPFSQNRQYLTPFYLSVLYYHGNP